MTDESYQIDKHWVRRAFDQAAERYDELAVLQHEVGKRLLERLDYIRLQPDTILDLGCGTGQLSGALLKRYRGSRVFGLDLAPGMLRQARAKSGWWRKPHYLAGDIESLPIADNRVDLLLSNLSFQWCQDLDRVLAECRRVLRPGGLLLFTTFGPDTLSELRSSWRAVDGRVHVNRFIDMHDIGDALLRARLADPVMDVERFTLTYPDVSSLMRELKGIGAHNVSAGRPRGLTGKAALQALSAHYETFRNQGVLPASYEVIYGHAWMPAAQSSPRQGPAEVSVPLDMLRR